MINRAQNLPSRRNDLFLNRNFSEIFDRFAKDFFSPGFMEQPQGFTPKVEVRETDKEYLIHAELPGMKESDINVSLRENTLVVEGEKLNETKEEEKLFYHSEIEYGNFYRAIPLNSDVDDKGIQAKYNNGTLEITLAKKNGEKGKSINIPINH